MYKIRVRPTLLHLKTMYSEMVNDVHTGFLKYLYKILHKTGDSEKPKVSTWDGGKKVGYEYKIHYNHQKAVGFLQALHGHKYTHMHTI